MYDIKGSVDLHVHASPSLFPRVGTDMEIVRRAKLAGIRAIALKSHHESTVSRAYYAEADCPGIRVIGGVVLNHFVGGLNPDAVEACLRLGGRLVWLPTGDAAHHAVSSGLEHPGMLLHSERRQGKIHPISVTDLNGHLDPQLIEIMEIIKEHDGVLCTAHISPEETLAVVQETARRGVKTLVNHVMYIPKSDLDYYVKLADAGAVLEVCAANFFPGSIVGLNYTDFLELLECIGYEHLILATDCGLPQFPWPEEAFRVFLINLAAKGVPFEWLDFMAKKLPAQLVGLDATENEGKR